MRPKKRDNFSASITSSGGVNMSMTTSAHDLPNRYLEELAEQIIAITAALEELRGSYVAHQEAKKPKLAGTASAQPRSAWGLGSIATSSTSPQEESIYDENERSPLPPNQHPVVLATWAVSESDATFFRELARLLQSLISDKRKYSRDVELAKLRSQKDHDFDDE
ncbi:hypothetical protein K493DRAFT_349005 [Basidiobolus meristosporus CBS 931.73]|uniref:Uncharacterized protein n=1 Tax=Basidiobolus meristosporus CBS 931.73 TaxID=1314790 RepID=A0A1Y1YLB6_9FUNG|nr:hypothetical protein K493DRAFT_349005 [Basidiobolus meristosporus CBS 931.73]|eukprot:ORX98788.1 hypothetical protein K493DRAFT_349005 [Basidiobolus meristosporus CBS 931.73]